MAYFKITQNKKGLQQAKIQVSGKDIATGKNKLFVKRVYNTDNLSEAKFRKYVEKCSIEFEEDVARAYREGTAAVTSRVLTFPELMTEWMAHVKSDYSISYYNRANVALAKFIDYLKENNLYDKPVTEITVRDIQVFLNRCIQNTYATETVKLKKPLPICMKGSEVNRKGIMSQNTFGNLNRGKSVLRALAEKLCVEYGLSFDDYFVIASNNRHKYSYVTIGGYKKLLNTVFEDAVRYDWIPKNPVKYTKISGHKTDNAVTEKEIFTLAETKEFIRHLDELPSEKIYIKTVLKFMLLTGVRNAEMCGLRWSDIDFEEKVVHIRRNRMYSNITGCYEKSPKTKTSIRDIPLTSDLIKDLQDYMAWFIESDDEFRSKLDKYYLAVGITREPIHPDTTGDWLGNIEKLYGMKHITPHGLRHTFCSILLSQCVPIQTVSRYMGHSNSTVTLRVYTHFVPDTKDKAINVLNKITE